MGTDTDRIVDHGQMDTWFDEETGTLTMDQSITTGVILLITILPGEDTMIQQQLYYDYSGRGHTSEFGDTSSTETLGPPHNHSDSRLALKDKEDATCPVSPRRSSLVPVDKEKLKVSLPQDLAHREVQKLFKERINRLSFKTFLRVFLVALIFVIFVLTCSVIIVFESESSLLQGVRSSREMMLLRLQYYQPIVKCIKGWLGVEA